MQMCFDRSTRSTPPPLKCYSITVAAVAAVFEREKCVRGTSKIEVVAIALLCMSQQ